MIIYRWNVKVLLSHPTVDLHFLRQNIIPFDVFLVLTSPPRTMESLQFPPFAATSTSWDRRRLRDDRGKRLGVKSIHHQFFHAFFGVVELVV